MNTYAIKTTINSNQFFTILFVFLIGVFGVSFFGNAQKVTISNFTPISAEVGSSVTITGSNFNPVPTSNVVIFGATRATVTSATVSKLIVTVPTGATYSEITVLNKVSGLLAYSSTKFVPSFATSSLDASVYDKVDFTTGNEPQDVSIGDLDGDGKVDLVVANRAAGSFSIFRNNSSSNTVSYAPKMDFTTSSNPWSVAVGDLDGDGKADLALANYRGHTISIFRNTSSPGAISFDFVADLTAEIGPWSIAIGDLDLDGKADLAVANFSSMSVSVYRNTSNIESISFAPNERVFSTSNTDSSIPYSIAIGDLDLDGKPDLAVAKVAGNTISLLRNTSSTGNISYAAEVNLVSGADFANSNPKSDPISIVIGDLDLDGKPDLAVANNGSNTISIFKNFSSPGTISYSDKVDFSTGLSPNTVSISDLDGDGSPDLAVSSSGSNTVSLHRNKGLNATIDYEDKVDIAMESSPNSVIVGDLTNDGIADLAVTIFEDNTLSIIANNSSQPPVVSTYSPADDATDAATASDLVLNFSENVKVGEGSIVIRENGVITQTIQVTDDVVSVSGNSVTINTSDFTKNSEVSVQIEVGAFQDLNSNEYEGISDLDTWSFIVGFESQSISFDPLSAQTFGASNYNLMASASSGLQVSYSSSNPNVAMVNGNELFIMGVGTTTITAMQDGNENYAAATPIQQTLVVNKASQSITFDALEDKTFGASLFDLTAVSSSGLAVEYSSSNESVATVTGGAVDIVGAGSTIITAKQLGDENYEAASPVSQNLTVKKATQVISITDIADKFVDDSSFTIQATVDSGLELTYSLSGPASISGTTVTLDNSVGTVEVTAKQGGNANYLEATPAVVSFEVTDPCSDFTAEAINVINVGCNGGSNGSFEISVIGTAPFNYVLNGAAQESGIFSNLAAGIYEVIVTDANSCSQTVIVNISEPELISISGEVTNSTSIIGDGSITAIAVGGTGTLTYAWNNGDTTSNIQELNVGEYTVTVTDENDCSISKSFTVGGITAAEESLQHEITIYPNPTAHSVQIVHSDAIGHIYLYNAEGKVLLRQRAEGRESIIKMLKFPSGLYFIRMDNSSVSYRVVKE